MLRGWLTSRTDHNNATGTQDWLMIAEPIDCPPEDESYRVTEHLGGHGLWMPNLYGGGKTALLRFRDNVRFTVHADDSASLTGTAYVYSAGGGPGMGDEWQMNLTWTYKGQGPAFGGPKIERPALQPPWLSNTWRYWDLDSGTITRPGSSLSVTQRPANGKYPLQVGDSANNKNERYGMSMWLYWKRTEAGGACWSGIGDFNVELIHIAPEGDCCPAPDTYNLGVAQDYNVFVCGDYNGAVDVRGKVAAAGDASFTNFSIGESANGGDVLVVGGNVTLDAGTVHGSAKYGASGTATGSVNFVNGAMTQGNPIDFGAACAAASSTSGSLGGLDATGTTVVQPWGGIELSGSDLNTNVFTVSGTDITATSHVILTVPAGAKVVINVTGVSADFSAMGITVNGGMPSRILWNAPTATSINLASLQLPGSLLAPNAAVTFNNGHIRGTLIAASVTGNGEAHQYLFDGDIEVDNCPDDDPTPKALCAVEYDLVNAWPGGFQASVKVHYNGPPVSGWLVDWLFAGSEIVVYGWNGLYSQGGNGVWVYNAAWNGVLHGGEVIELGFIGAGTPLMPTAFWLNLKKCQVLP